MARIKRTARGRRGENFSVSKQTALRMTALFLLACVGLLVWVFQDMRQVRQAKLKEVGTVSQVNEPELVLHCQPGARPMHSQRNGVHYGFCNPEGMRDWSSYRPDGTKDLRVSGDSECVRIFIDPYPMSGEGANDLYPLQEGGAPLKSIVEVRERLVQYLERKRIFGLEETRPLLIETLVDESNLMNVVSHQQFENATYKTIEWLAINESQDFVVRIHSANAGCFHVEKDILEKTEQVARSVKIWE